MTSTGGGKTYTRDDYSSHGRRLYSKFIETSENLEAKSDSDLIGDVVYAVVTAKDSSIKDSRHRLKSVGVEVIQIDAKDKSRGIAVSTKSDFKRLRLKVETYATTDEHTGKSYFSSIESIEEVDPLAKIDTELLKTGVHNCIIYLYSRLSNDEQRKVLQDISVKVQVRQEAASKFLRTSSSGLALTVTLNSERIIELATSYNSIRLIKMNASLRLEPAIVGEIISPITRVATSETNVIVAVLDSGIVQGSPFISPFVVARFEDLGLGSSFDTSHGTLVASRIIYGNDLEDQVNSGNLLPKCHVIDVPLFYRDVFGRDQSLMESDVIDLLNNFVDSFPQVRIFNLSFGTPNPINSGSISALANELDSIAKKFDKTFIVASGNMRHGEPHDWATFPAYLGDPDTRINAPAESILSLAVGSYSHVQSMTDISLPMQISAFSRTGPGMDGGIKPDLVSIGGNCFVSSGDPDFRNTSAAVGLDATGKRLAYNIGTSFSAPIVSHYAAQILGSDPQMSANLLKCYLLHFASNSGLNGAISAKPDNIYGFGEFQDADYQGSNISRMIFIHEGELSSDQYSHIPFHIPRLFDSQTSKKLKIKFTLIHDPEVDSDNPAEYSLADILFVLSKNVTGVKQKVTGTNESLSKYSSKFNPVVKYERVFDRQFSSGEWEIRLRLNTRGRLDEDYKQAFALIIECIDETGTIDMYRSFMSDFGADYIIPMTQPGSAV
ncbi:S8 family peptidase [Deinococcus detaillensis]|uniref:S8 family peptidase n=1 Tax=Deinococcus detaillensis TaxID=2592048 RepID=UPI00163D9F23|nr:S8 family peptidase [Deinococcus detaillensis]